MDRDALTHAQVDFHNLNTAKCWEVADCRGIFRGGHAFECAKLPEDSVHNLKSNSNKTAVKVENL